MLIHLTKFVVDYAGELSYAYHCYAKQQVLHIQMLSEEFPSDRINENQSVNTYTTNRHE